MPALAWIIGWVACSSDNAVIDPPTTTSGPATTSGTGATGGAASTSSSGTAASGGAGAAGVGGAGGAGGAGGSGGGLDPAQALTPQWDRHFNDSTGQAYARAVAIGPSGEVAVAGVFSGTIDFGGGPLVSNGDDIFIAKLSSTGGYLWAKRFGDAEIQGVGGLAFDGAGHLVIAGSFIGELDFGLGALDASGSQFTDVYVAKLDQGGNEIWAHRYGDINAQEGSDISLGPGGEIYVVGTFQNVIDFGGGALVTGGDRDAFVLELDSGGVHQRSEAFGDTANQYGLAVTALPNGYAIAGVTEGNIDLGGGSLANPNGPRSFWARYATGGAHLVSQVLAGTGENRGVALAAVPGGDVALTGTFKSGIDLGSGTLPGNGNDDVYLARFASGGALVASRTFGDSASQKPLDLAHLAQGPLVVGRYQGVMTLGGTSLSGAGSFDGFAIIPDALRYYVFGDGMYQAATAVAVDATGRIVVAGDYSGTIELGSGFTSGNLSAFVASFAPL